MTPTRDRLPSRGPNIVGLVKRDVGRAVREAAAQTDSPYFGHARLHRDLDPLRERLTLLEQRRPDLLAQVADHFEVPPTARDVATAAQDLAGRLLERRYAQGDPEPGSRTFGAADAGPEGRRADTAQQVRAQGSRATPQRSRMRR